MNIFLPFEVGLVMPHCLTGHEKSTQERRYNLEGHLSSTLRTRWGDTWRLHACQILVRLEKKLIFCGSRRRFPLTVVNNNQEPGPLKFHSPPETSPQIAWSREAWRLCADPGLEHCNYL